MDDLITNPVLAFYYEITSQLFELRKLNRSNFTLCAVGMIDERVYAAFSSREKIGISHDGLYDEFILEEAYVQLVSMR